MWHFATPLFEDVGGPAGLLVCQGQGPTVWWHAGYDNRQLWQGESDVATLSIPKNPEETDLRTDQAFMGCTDIKLYAFVFPIFPTWTMIRSCCPYNWSEEHHSHSLDASSMGSGSSCTWGMKGWQLVLAGLWKLFPGYNFYCRSLSPKLKRLCQTTSFHCSAAGLAL